MFLKYALLFFFFAGLFTLNAQNFKVLHYTETSGYDHGTRSNSYSMFQSLGSQNGFTVDDDQTGESFDSLSNLQEYAVVVFSNTSGDQILNATQRANFEAYINGGGSFIGIHAASDTYRHSTANGNNTGTWDWYAENLGGSVQQNPNHTSANHNGTMDHIGTHPSTANLPDPWQKVEEYYYWENGYLNSAINDLLEVRSTGSNSYDAARPMSWYQNLPGGGKSFYTALGHANSNFTSDTAFQNHIRDAVLWAATGNISLEDLGKTTPFRLFPNPAVEELNITSSTATGPQIYSLLDLSGKVLMQGRLNFQQQKARLEIRDLPSGHYLLQLGSEYPSSKEKLPFIVR